MPTPGFSKDITSIFNNNELKEQLRYDITCRLVCNALDVASVSMLIYDAQTDRLTCRGNYLGKKEKSHYSTDSKPKLEEVIEYISVFEYFDSELTELKSTTFADFKKSNFCGETNPYTELTETLFEELKTNWQRGESKLIYQRYKEKIHEEFHTIDKSSISGTYYCTLLNYGKILTSEIHKDLITNGPQKGEKYFSTWENAGIVIPRDSLRYVGLPLFANERYTGIIRVATFDTPESTIHPIFKDTDEDEKLLQEERLNNFSQLISLHLKTNYYLNGFRELSNIEIDIDNNLRVDKPEIDDLCNTLTTVIKCNGCIIRLVDTNSIKENPPIRGLSDSLERYEEYINNHPELTFSEDIYGLLSTKNKERREIKAVNFSVTDDSESDHFTTNEYFHNEEGKLECDNSNVRRFRDFTPDYIFALRQFNMQEIVVLKLEFQDGGFMILTNTKNRKFTSSDIEMVLLASKRIGLEIKQHQNTERIREQNKIIAQKEHAQLIIHQIGAPAEALHGHTKNLEEKVFEGIEVPKKISTLYRMSSALLRQITSLRKYLEWEIKPIVVKNENVYHLQSYIRSKAIHFEGLTVGRKIRIWTIIENEDNFNNSCRIDKSLFDEIMNCLLDNAVKYSFSDYEMTRKVPFFDPNNALSDGHIHIKLFSTEKSLIVTVENYGSPISDAEYDTIFERGVRGKGGKKKSPIGSGIGLYLVAKVVAALKGTKRVTHIKQISKTIFTVTLPQ